jgi:predicted O-methyltransferase YrrM
VSAFSKTAQYAGLTDLPPLVARAVALANELGFISCCFPEQGRLLQVLARGRAGGVIGETGTGCGAGLAWMASAVGPDTRLIEPHGRSTFWSWMGVAARSATGTRPPTPPRS